MSQVCDVDLVLATTTTLLSRTVLTALRVWGGGKKNAGMPPEPAFNKIITYRISTATFIPNQNQQQQLLIGN